MATGGERISLDTVKAKHIAITVGVVVYLVVSIVGEGAMGLVWGPVSLIMWVGIWRVYQGRRNGEQRLLRASAASAQLVPTTPRRKPISQAVRHEVWRRDQGRCVDCGSRERLEYDHIIPVVRGGANTVRNIELRCERCNRSKGARI
jgi:5-methylcytosine-specific restriction endonuclease McrA